MQETGAGRVQYEGSWARDQQHMSTVYGRERPVRFRTGTTILYCLDTWHRATPVAAGRCRWSHHHVWRVRGADFVQHQAFVPLLAQMPPVYMASLDVVQRAVLGFPAPGHEWWTAETVASAGQRYGMDMMTPYRQALLVGRL